MPRCAGPTSARCLRVHGQARRPVANRGRVLTPRASCAARQADSTPGRWQASRPRCARKPPSRGDDRRSSTRTRSEASNGCSRQRRHTSRSGAVKTALTQLTGLNAWVQLRLLLGAEDHCELHPIPFQLLDVITPASAQPRVAVRRAGLAALAAVDGRRSSIWLDRRGGTRSSRSGATSSSARSIRLAARCQSGRRRRRWRVSTRPSSPARASAC